MKFSCCEEREWCESKDVEKLEASYAELLETLNEAPVSSKYHGPRGFETNRFLADYEAWMENRRAAIAKAEGNVE